MTIWIILGIFILLGIVVVSKYNGIITLRNKREQSFGDIDVQLKLRFDLIPNLINTVKGYAEHEKSTLDAVVKARSNYENASDADGKIAASNMLSGALGGIFALSESYPDLKANASFTQLQTELSDIENKIASTRRFFNSATTEYNTYIEMFPTSVLAGMFNFKRAEMFEIKDEEERKVVKVEF